MTYLLVFDLQGNGAARKRLDRYLRRVACKVQHSVWEFKCLRDLERAAEFVRGDGGKALAFSRSDEILLHLRGVREVLRKLARLDV